MSDNLADAFNNFKKMVDSGNIPNEVKGIVNNLNNGNNSSNQALNDMLSQVSPEMLSNLSSMLHSNSSNNSGSSSYSNSSNTNSNSGFNLDAETLMKMTSVINAMNQKDNPGSNLLYSLKPYLRDSRKNKLDQYANLLNISKIADVLKNEKKENNNNV